jgi:hypothetical protein
VYIKVKPLKKDSPLFYFKLLLPTLRDLVILIYFKYEFLPLIQIIKHFTNQQISIELTWAIAQRASIFPNFSIPYRMSIFIRGLGSERGGEGRGYTGHNVPFWATQLNPA